MLASSVDVVHVTRLEHCCIVLCTGTMLENTYHTQRYPDQPSVRPSQSSRGDNLTSGYTTVELNSVDASVVHTCCSRHICDSEMVERCDIVT